MAIPFVFSTFLTVISSSTPGKSKTSTYETDYSTRSQAVFERVRKLFMIFIFETSTSDVAIFPELLRRF